ncbi:hypothetical protein OSB04_014424 [Centaurea solstitialis]|uniref:Uncharacterized protein n=1 Tax=Centaurea solstitialis TaxID=347529 RepID=A0AA38SX26_9ASTR|nr:hypothetical protein OSB04_014424 [Centaurea solstitialis]
MQEFHKKGNSLKALNFLLTFFELGKNEASNSNGSFGDGIGGIPGVNSSDMLFVRVTNMFSNDFYSNITVSVTTTTTPVTTTKFVITCITTIQLVLHEVVRTALMHMSVHKEPNLGTVFYFSQLHGDCKHLWAYHSHLLIETNIQTSPVCKENTTPNNVFLSLSLSQDT